MLFVKLLFPIGVAARFVAPVIQRSVQEGTAVKFICQSDSKRPIDDCKFSVPGFGVQTKIVNGLRQSKKFQFIGKRQFKSHCSFLLESVTRENAGRVKCTHVSDVGLEQVAKTDLKVLRPFEYIEIHSKGMGHVYEYAENDRMEFTCSLGEHAGEPAGFELSLSIGENFKI